MEESEKQNLREMFINTIKDLIEEKRNHSKYSKKLNKLNADINLILKDIGTFGIKFRNGSYEILENKGVEKPVLEIMATFENFFKYSSREIGDFKAILTGKLKVKGLVHLFLLLKIGLILKVIPEKELEK
ncbi:MAG: SCP2 sterol-binding domain-containing protein [Candidatus Helarchaeota archaeon]